MPGNDAAAFEAGWKAWVNDQIAQGRQTVSVSDFLNALTDALPASRLQDQREFLLEWLSNKAQAAMKVNPSDTLKLQDLLADGGRSSVEGASSTGARAASRDTGLFDTVEHEVDYLGGAAWDHLQMLEAAVAAAGGPHNIPAAAGEPAKQTIDALEAAVKRLPPDSADAEAYKREIRELRMHYERVMSEPPSAMATPIQRSRVAAVDALATLKVVMRDQGHIPEPLARQAAQKLNDYRKAVREGGPAAKAEKGYLKALLKGYGAITDDALKASLASGLGGNPAEGSAPVGSPPAAQSTARARELESNASILVNVLAQQRGARSRCLTARSKTPT